MFSSERYQHRLIITEWDQDKEDAVINVLLATTPKNLIHHLYNKHIRKALVSVYLTGMLRYYKESSFYKKIAGDLPYVCLAMKSSYYGKQYCSLNPHLEPLFKKLKLNGRKALLLKKILRASEAFAIDKGFTYLTKESILSTEYTPLLGKGQLSRLYYHPLQSREACVDKKSSVWKQAEKSNFYLVNWLYPIAPHAVKNGFEYQYKKQEGSGYTKVIVESNTKHSRHVRDLIKNKNSLIVPGQEDLMNCRIITNNSLLFGSRIYSNYAQIKKEVRAEHTYMLVWKTDDIKSSVATYCYLVHTGKHFSHPVYGSDIYMYIGSMVAKDTSWGNLVKTRSLIKELYTVATGHDECSDESMLISIISHMEKNGFLYENPTFDKFYSEKKKQADILKEGLPSKIVLHEQFLSQKQSLIKEAIENQKRRYAAYCRRNDIADKSIIPRISPQDVVTFFRTDEVISKMAFHNHYQEYFGVETMTNIALIGYAVEKGINFQTVHDEISANQENIEELSIKRNELMLVSAKIYKNLFYKLDQIINNLLQNKEKEGIKKAIKKAEKEINEGENKIIDICYRATFRHLLIEKIRERWRLPATIAA